MSDRKRLGKPVEVVKWDLTQKTILMAPPVVFQERSRRDGDCHNAWTEKYVVEQQERMLSIKCGPPFECREDVLSKKELAVFSCLGEQVKQGSEQTHFGLELVEVMGQSVYADLLYSLTDHDFLFRDGEIKRTEDFFDSGTRKAGVVFLFYTPAAGVTTVLRIFVDFSAENVHVKTKFQHYLMLEGEYLTRYAVMLPFEIDGTL